MRILHITECYEGGVSRAMNSIALAAPSHEHLLMYSGSDTPTETYSVADRLPNGFLSRCRALKEAIAALSPDIVHAHSSWAGVYTRVQKLAVPVVYQPHCYASEMNSGLKAVAFYAAERILGRNTAKVAVLSPRELHLASKLSPKAQHVRVPNIPSLDEDLFGRKETPKRTVLMIGRICKQKDPVNFANVAIEVKREHPDVEFLWVGDGQYVVGREALEHAGVQITGWLDERNLAKIVSSAGVYYHSASYEGFPLSVLDAAQGGLPILTRDIPAFEGSGLLHSDTAESSAAVIMRLFQDENYREEVTALSMQLLKTMSFNAQKAGLGQLYRSDRLDNVTV